jgi:hypothetical protein
MTADAYEYLVPDGNGAWSAYMAVLMEDTLTTAPGFDQSGERSHAG